MHTTNRPYKSIIPFFPASGERVGVRGRFAAYLLAVSFLLLASGPAQAVEALRPALADMSKKVEKLLKGRNETTIAVGAFTGPSRCPTSSGPGIKKVLIEELEKLGLKIQNRAGLEIKADYLDVLDPDSQVLFLRLKATILDQAGNAIAVLDQRVESRQVLAQVMGVTRSDVGAAFSLDPRKESEALKGRIDKPSVAIIGSRISSEKKSPYGIAILAKSGNDYEPLRPAEDDGLAYVKIPQGKAFAVRLINDSDHDAAVELTLDGLSMFAFSDNRNYRQVIVPSKRTSLIKGWHRSNDLSEEFLMTTYAKSAVAQLLPSSDQIGTITATFAAAWDPSGPPPKDESSAFRDPFNPAIGKGDPVRTPFREVVRQHGRVRDVVSVRYKK